MIDLPAQERRPAALAPRESLYLDLVRALASFTVVVDHAAEVFDLPNAPRWGHQAVMVFFVLSGYVICTVADTRETSARRFVVARLARLWSVLLPAVALTIACDLVGRIYGHHSETYAQAPINLPFVRVGAVLIFLSDSWVSVQPLSNSVVWSLCAEFWYYMLFAAWTFVPRGRARAAMLVVLAVLAGDKALLMLPIWLLGVALQRSRGLRRLSVGAHWVLWAGGLGAIAAVLVLRAYDPVIAITARAVGPWLFRQLAPARVFWFDWIFGVAIAAHLLGSRTVMSRIPLEQIARPVRWCAGVSFAAYLFHMPLLHLCAAFLAPEQGSLALALTLAAIAALGYPAERSKRWWLVLLDHVADVAAARRQLGRSAAAPG